MTRLRRWWSSSRLFRLGLVLLTVGSVLDGLYHSILFLPVSEQVQRYMFPFSGPSHILILVGFDIVLVGITLSRRAGARQPISGTTVRGVGKLK